MTTLIIPRDKSAPRWGRTLTPIGITMGDPGGIGPEVAVKAALDGRVVVAVHPRIFGDSDLIQRMARDLGHKIDFMPYGSRGRRLGDFVLACERVGEGRPRVLFSIVNTKKRGRNPPVGRPSKMGGLAAGRAIEEAVRLSTLGWLRGIVTAPVSKQSLSLAGYGMTGHTELLARLTKTKHYAMMMKNGPLRVVLATTHVPLAKVASRLTPEDLADKIRLTHDYLVRNTRIKRPLIAVCGLNPHAGEGGMLGREEQKVIAPAVRRSKERGILVAGPLSADSVFGPDHIVRYNAVVAMYHDQGIIPVKMGDPGTVINITLGLPFVRTSPGHGTAFDIAGKGVASAESMVAAILECGRMVNRRWRMELEAGGGRAGGRAGG